MYATHEEQTHSQFSTRQGESREEEKRSRQTVLFFLGDRGKERWPGESAGTGKRGPVARSGEGQTKTA